MTGPAPAGPRLGRSVLAVLAGLVVVVVLSVSTDMALHAVGVYPAPGQVMSNPLLLLATFYRTLYGVLSSYVTARLAPNRPMQHALIVGVIGFGLSITGAVLTWNKGPAFGPHWYPVSLAVFALPQAWVGGKLGSYEKNNSPQKY